MAPLFLKKPKINPMLKEYTQTSDEKQNIPHPTKKGPALFKIDCSRYLDLISVSYDFLSNLGFHKTIPFCLYQYYAITLLWRRFAILNQKISSLVVYRDEPEDLFNCKPSNLLVPDHLYRYLANIGRVSDPFNIIWQPEIIPSLVPHQYLSHHGLPFPGRHKFDYSALVQIPYPRIAILKITADITYTTGQISNPNWMIPNNLLMQSPQPWTHPNRHLLGYHLAEKLTPAELFTLTSNGFRTSLNFEQTFTEDYPINVGALRAVNKTLIQTLPATSLFSRTF